MKIDKRDPRHWVALMLFFLWASAGLALRWCQPWRKRSNILLYGHRLNGNLLALYRRIEADADPARRVAFLALDAAYATQLRESGIQTVTATGAGCMRALSGAAALVSDHGLHAMQPLQRMFRQAGLRFFDVWHGIPFKGFDDDDFRLQHRYDETWVASPINAELYVQRFGFHPPRVQVTGYARTDRLVAPDPEPTAMRRARLGIPVLGQVVLFAPTWAQDDGGRNIFPFGHDAETFLGALSELAVDCGGTLVLRTHLNTKASIPAFPNVVELPASRYPDTEDILLASDVLVCDWSSVAFDFLLLERPAFFLDIQPPFRKGFSLGPEYRFGAVVASLGALLEGLSGCLTEPAGYWRLHRGSHDRVREKVYGGYADGHSSRRCIERLAAHVPATKIRQGTHR